MNKVVIVGAIVVIVVAIAVGVLLANHQNNNYASTSTTTNNGTNIISNTSTTTSSIPITSTTTSTTQTNVTTNTTINVPYNTFYFLNKTNSTSYYIFVLSYNEYESILENATVHQIFHLVVNLVDPVSVTKNIVVGNYVFLIGYTSLPLNVSIGHQYPIAFIIPPSDIAPVYQFTYEGNWVGPLP